MSRYGYRTCSVLLFFLSSHRPSVCLILYNSQSAKDYGPRNCQCTTPNDSLVDHGLVGKTPAGRYILNQRNYTDPNPAMCYTVVCARGRQRLKGADIVQRKQTGSWPGEKWNPFRADDPLPPAGTPVVVQKRDDGIGQTPCKRSKPDLERSLMTGIPHPPMPNSFYTLWHVQNSTEHEKQLHPTFRASVFQCRPRQLVYRGMKLSKFDMP